MRFTSFVIAGVAGGLLLACLPLVFDETAAAKGKAGKGKQEREDPVEEVEEAKWVVVRTPHLHVFSDGGDDMAERVARRLEELRASLATAAPALVAEVAPVQVIVFKEKGLARAYAPDGAGGDGAGFFLGGPDRRRLFFRDDKDRVPSVSQHEYTHALLDAALPDAPLWLNEGLAEYFSTFRLDPERPRAGSALLDHVQALHDYRLMPLSDLFAVKRSSPAYHEMDRGSVYYAQTWALVHMLLHETGKDPGPKRLERVIVAARDGEKFEVAFHREYGDEKALLLRLQAYVDQERFVERAWPGMTNRYPEDGLAPNDVPTADMMATLGISLLARLEPQTAEAERHLHEALERDERHAEACAGMGWLEVMRQHRAESRAYFERSFAADSVSAPSVRLMASQLILDARQQRASSERDEQVRFARRMLQSALTHSPDDPELQALAARTWVAMPGNDPETGYKLGVRAFAALPGRSDVQLDLVALSALTGRDADAKRLAERFLKPDAPPHHRRTARLALLAGDVRTANQLVQKGNAAAAQAAIQAARQRVADDPELLAETDRLIAHFQGALAMQNETRDENVAVAEYNAGVKAANAEHFAEAAAAFRRAAEKTTRETFRTESLRKARRMDARGQTEKATVLAKAGDKKAAKTILETVDRDVLTEEELRWVDETLGQLRK